MHLPGGRIIYDCVVPEKIYNAKDVKIFKIMKWMHCYFPKGKCEMELKCEGPAKVECPYHNSLAWLGRKEKKE